MQDLRDVYEPSVLASCSGLQGKDLPMPPLPLPPFHPATGERWQFRFCFLPAAPGYFRGPQPLMSQIATLVRDGATWMSTAPMEIESQMPHAAVSHGKVAICGLGLGVMAYAVAARRSVDKVVVIERDPEVTELFHAHSGFAQWPQREKIEIVIDDARNYACKDLDFLYADIWPRYRMAETIPDMQAIHKNCPAPACGYWGQELDMIDWAAAQGTPVEAFSMDDVHAFAEAHGLPLIGDEIDGYAELCRRAAQNPTFQVLGKGAPSALGGTDRPMNPASSSTVKA